MRGVKLLASSLAALAIGAVWMYSACPPAKAYEIIQTQGRRLWIDAATQRLLVTDAARSRLALYDVSGEQPRKLGEFGDQGRAPGELMGPHGALLASGGELVVADTFNQRIQSFRVEPLLAGLRPALVRVWGARGGYAGRGMDGPFALAVSPRTGRVYVADSRHGRVLGFDEGRHPLEPGIGAGQIKFPAGMAFDATGRWLFVADEWGARVALFDMQSERLLMSLAGGEGGSSWSAPAGIATGPDGDVWVADKGAKRVFRLRVRRGADGVPIGLMNAGGFGRVGIGAGEWTYPQTIAIDARERVYVCDQLDLRCQRFDAQGGFLGAFAEDWQPAQWTAPVAQPKNANSPGAHALCSAGGSYGLRFETAPQPIPLNEPFDLKVDLRDSCEAGGAPAEVERLWVDARMPEHRHGMNSEARVARVATGRYEVRGLLFHMAGLWELYFDVAKDGVLERVQYDVRIE